MRRVERPTSRTSKPVANGSSVPAWPIRRSPRLRRATSTTSCDVTPDGLSTSKRPSAGGPLIRRRRFLRQVRRLRLGVLLDLLEQRLDAGRPGDAVVGAEGDLGCDAKAECSTDPAAKVGRD